MIHISSVLVNMARKLGLEWLGKKVSRYEELEKENEQLRLQLDLKLAHERLVAEMVHRDGAYWKNDGGGPYCKVCLVKDHIAMPLDEGATKGVYGCPIHEGTYWSPEYRESRAHRSARPRFLTWSKQGAYLEAQSRRRAG
jgi:hypothetical protein